MIFFSKRNKSKDTEAELRTLYNAALNELTRRYCNYQEGPVCDEETQESCVQCWDAYLRDKAFKDDSGPCKHKKCR